MRPGLDLSKFGARGFRLFVAPPITTRGGRWATIGALMAILCTVDYLSGIDISLAIFYLVPVSFAAGWLGARAGVGVAGACTLIRLGSDMLASSPAPLPGYLWWNVGAGLLIYLFVVWLVDTLVSAHHGLQGRIEARTSELAQAIAERRRLELEVLDVSARERAAVGRELHDELGQHLVATALAAKVLTQRLGSDAGAREAQAIVGWIEAAIAKTRQLARGLLVARIESDRFVSELEEVAAPIRRSGVQCRVHAQGAPLRANAAHCAQLFRLTQEAIGNALRHAQATAIDITIEQTADGIRLSVADNGRGFDPSAASNGMGLRIMTHRAQLIGARLTIDSAPGRGTTVTCDLPPETP